MKWKLYLALAIGLGVMAVRQEDVLLVGHWDALVR